MLGVLGAALWLASGLRLFPRAQLWLAALSPQCSQGTDTIEVVGSGSGDNDGDDDGDDDDDQLLKSDLHMRSHPAVGVAEVETSALGLCRLKSVSESDSSCHKDGETKIDESEIEALI